MIRPRPVRTAFKGKRVTAPLEIAFDKPVSTTVRLRADALTLPYSRPPVPIVDIAHKSDIKVVYTTFPKFQDAVAGLCDFKGQKILVNVEDPPEQQAFTVAHELGHWLLHREEILKHPERYSVLPRFRLPEPSPLEVEAYTFAAHVLVPRRLLSPVMNSAPPVALAKIFNVPIDLVEYRLRHG
jgi:Zn-dependent peptidase ImmA (M78 family)